MGGRALWGAPGAYHGLGVLRLPLASRIWASAFCALSAALLSCSAACPCRASTALSRRTQRSLALGQLPAHTSGAGPGARERVSILRSERAQWHVL